MNAFETSTTVQALGEIRVPAVPFAPGTEVEVIISPKRLSPDEFSRAWHQICRELRSTTVAKTLTDDEIQQEIADYRAGR
jgi:hypothetical protein